MKGTSDACDYRIVAFFVQEEMINAMPPKYAIPQSFLFRQQPDHIFIMCIRMVRIGFRHCRHLFRDNVKIVHENSRINAERVLASCGMCLAK
jgi:hypothetical protein